MCLEINKIPTSEHDVEFPKPLVAGKNIICYKRGKIQSDGTLKPSHRSTFKYKKEVLTDKVKFGKLQWFSKFAINEGYHSCILFNDKNMSPNHVFIIPKDSEYYIGGINDKHEKDGYVSDSLIWIGHKWNPITWFKVHFKYKK